MQEQTRREFMKQTAQLGAALVLVPTVVSCGAAGTAGETPKPGSSTDDVPKTKPVDWEPLAFNRDRGNDGAIPASYLDDINGPDGETKHLGKHLPYLHPEASSLAPEGFVALMWGDADKGYARHPNAVRSEANHDEGHWYNWIRVRKATEEDADESESRFTDWPQIAEGDTGRYATLGGGDITEDDGRNTVYVVALPADVKQGDTVRIWAHCLTHGEYVDFLTV